MRRARRVDANLKEVVATFRKMGCSVWVCNSEVDAVIGYGGIAALIEVKDGAKSASRRKYTKAQIEMREWWTGGIRLVTCLDDVAAAVRWLRASHKALCASQGGMR